MAVLDELKKDGWCISEEGLNQLGEDGKVTNVKIILKKALDVDLREIAAPGFPDEVGRCKVEGIPGGLVVQLQKVRNVSAPKANEESAAAPRMLKITLTDGHSTCHAIEIERIPALTVNTPPGTKILLKAQPDGENIPVASNYLLLTPDRAEVLGGKVAAMIEKWELNRSLAKHKRTVGEDGGPPPWIPFGQKIMRPNANDKNFKSLQDKDKLGVDNLNPEFEAQRKDAIAEAGRVGAKKIFGGGNRQLLDHNVQQIVGSGFTVEQAEEALKVCRNNVDRAIKSLQKASEPAKPGDLKKGDKDGERGDRDRGERGERSERGERGGRSARGVGRGRAHDDDNPSSGPKPSGRVSLFDFLSDKLPLDEKEKSFSGPSRGVERAERGGRGGGSGGIHRGGGSVRGGSGRGRGGGRGTLPDRGDRQREDNRPKDDSFRRDFTRGERVESRRGRKEDSISGRGGSKGGTDQKAPRFQNQRSQLQHESTRFVGHTPASSISTNSTVGQGGTDWGTALSGKGGMMSLLDCENTPESDMLFGNSTWSNSTQSGENFQGFDHSRPPPQQQQRQRDSGRFANQVNNNQGGRNQRPFQQQNRQNAEYTNNSSGPKMDGFGTSGPPGSASGSRGFFNNSYVPEIPDFPFKDNANSSNMHANNHGGFQGNSAPGKGKGQDPKWNWRRGDKCMAKYWEDERYYNAEVTGVSDKTCVVRFTEYGNHEEVLKDDCLPITDDELARVLQQSLGLGNSANPVNPPNSNQSTLESNSTPFSGVMEFRKGGTRPYFKQSSENSGSLGRERRQPRAPQSMYIPPAQRK